VGSRLARDDEVDAWREDGWVVLEGLIGAGETDAAAADLAGLFPTPEQYHADPEGETERWLGRPAPEHELYTWPANGPGFRPEQHRWSSHFPLRDAAALNRLCVHPSIVDFMERALATADVRIYQAQATAKYTGLTNYEQPMHTDRNHSWLPAFSGTPWYHVEGFLFLSDVDAGTAPTHLVRAGDAAGHEPTLPIGLPKRDPELFAAERAATGVRGSFLAYRNDVFHRAVDLTAPGGSRFLLNVSYKVAGIDWIGYHSWQSNATSPDWTAFVEGSTPRELALFGFPEPGNPIWTPELLAMTADAYPKLDLSPWRAAIEGTG
jgi:hypothetical protein